MMFFSPPSKKRGIPICRLDRVQKLLGKERYKLTDPKNSLLINGIYTPR